MRPDSISAPVSDFSAKPPMNNEKLSRRGIAAASHRAAKPLPGKSQNPKSGPRPKVRGPRSKVLWFKVQREREGRAAQSPLDHSSLNVSVRKGSLLPPIG